MVSEPGGILRPMGFPVVIVRARSKVGSARAFRERQLGYAIGAGGYTQSNMCSIKDWRRC